MKTERRGSGCGARGGGDVRGLRLWLCGLCLLGGCNALPTGLANKPVGPYDRPYPRELAQGETLDIQVIREPETTISMTKRV